MLKGNRIIALLIPLSLSIAACSNVKNEDIGMATGAVAGGLIGSTIGGGSGKTAATIVGAAGGAYIGKKIGENYDEK